MNKNEENSGGSKRPFILSTLDIKSLFSSFGAADKKTEDDLYHENELTTNRITSLITLVYLTVTMFAIFASVFGFYDLVSNLYVRFYLGSCLLVAAALLYAALRKFDGMSVRYVLLTALILGFTTTHFMNFSYAKMLIMLPIIISMRYLNKKFSLSVALMSAAAYLISSIANILLDHFSSEFAYLHMLEQVQIWNSWDYALKYAIIPTMIIFAIEALIAVTITESGRRLISRQIDNAEKNASLQSQLSLAAAIQAQALPEGSYTAPDGSCSVTAFVTPAKEVGGDFYDYFMQDDHTLCFLEADVSDKGIPAAMFMMAAKKALFFAFNNNETDMAAAAESANEMLCAGNESAMFLTLWLGKLDLTTGEMDFINCGHPDAVLKHADDSVEFIKERSYGVMGMFEGMEIAVHHMKLERGESILICTDGVTDALSASGEAFGNDRLLTAASLPGPLSGNVSAKLFDFSKNADQFDDITLMEISRKA